MHLTPELEVPGCDSRRSHEPEGMLRGIRRVTLPLSLDLTFPYLATHCGTGEQARQERGAHSLRLQPIPASAAAHPRGIQCVQTTGRHILTTRPNQSNASTAHTRPEPTRTSAAKTHVSPGEPCQRQWKGYNGLSLTPGRTHVQSASHGRTSPWPLPGRCMAGTRPAAARLRGHSPGHSHPSFWPQVPIVWPSTTQRNSSHPDRGRCWGGGGSAVCAQCWHWVRVTSRAEEGGVAEARSMWYGAEHETRGCRRCGKRVRAQLCG